MSPVVLPRRPAHPVGVGAGAGASGPVGPRVPDPVDLRRGGTPHRSLSCTRRSLPRSAKVGRSESRWCGRLPGPRGSSSALDGGGPDGRGSAAVAWSASPAGDRRPNSGPTTSSESSNRRVVARPGSDRTGAAMVTSGRKIRLDVVRSRCVPLVGSWAGLGASGVPRSAATLPSRTAVPQRSRSGGKPLPPSVRRDRSDCLAARWAPRRQSRKRSPPRWRPPGRGPAGRSPRRSRRRATPAPGASPGMVTAAPGRLPDGVR